MRRQKRDMSDRAFHKGYQAGFSGKNKGMCPHQQETLRQNWLTGWREGRQDSWEGYSQVEALQRTYAQ